MHYLYLLNSKFMESIFWVPVGANKMFSLLYGVSSHLSQMKGQRGMRKIYRFITFDIIVLIFKINKSPCILCVQLRDTEKWKCMTRRTSLFYSNLDPCCSLSYWTLLRHHVKIQTFLKLSKGRKGYLCPRLLRGIRFFFFTSPNRNDSLYCKENWLQVMQVLELNICKFLWKFSHGGVFD